MVMASDGDLPVSLPSPPPPRPAARREAMDAAMRRFDGIEEPSAPRQPRRRLGWSSLHRRPAGALVAATLIAVIAIPVIQLGIRDPATEQVGSEEETAAPAQPAPASKPPVPAAEAPRPSADTLAQEAPPPPQGPAPAVVVRQRSAIAASPDEQKLAADMPAPAMATAPPPPPPPPPAAPAQRQAQAQAEADTMEVAAGGGDIVVTGSRIERPRLESASPVAAIDAYDAFLSRLQGALRSDDRDAVVRLVGFPLRVTFAGGARTYRSPGEVERDFDRIFTPAVRSAALALRAGSLGSRDGRLVGNRRIGIGCSQASCRSPDAIRIREIRP